MENEGETAGEQGQSIAQSPPSVHARHPYLLNVDSDDEGYCKPLVVSICTYQQDILCSYLFISSWYRRLFSPCGRILSVQTPYLMYVAPYLIPV